MGLRRNPSRIGQGGAGLDRLTRPRSRNCPKIEDDEEDEDDSRKRISTALFEFVNRAFLMGRHQALACAVHQKVHLLEQGLADEDFIAHDQRVVTGTALHDFEAHAVRKADITLGASLSKRNTTPLIERPEPTYENAEK